VTNILNDIRVLLAEVTLEWVRSRNEFARNLLASGVDLAALKAALGKRTKGRVPLAPGESLPPIPAGGFASAEEISQLPGARQINEGGLVPGPSAEVYAFYRGTIHRNLYRIPLLEP
jgi:hypothetical protein